MTMLPCFSYAQNTEVKLKNLELYQGYINLVESFYTTLMTSYSIASDSELSVVLQLQKMGDIYKESGHPEKIIPILKAVLKETKNQTIRNSAYHLLAEKQKEIGEYENAIETLKISLSENLKLVL